MKKEKQVIEGPEMNLPPKAELWGIWINKMTKEKEVKELKEDFEV